MTKQEIAKIGKISKSIISKRLLKMEFGEILERLQKDGQEILAEIIKKSRKKVSNLPYWA